MMSGALLDEDFGRDQIKIQGDQLGELSRFEWDSERISNFIEIFVSKRHLLFSCHLTLFLILILVLNNPNIPNFSLLKDVKTIWSIVSTAFVHPIVFMDGTIIHGCAPLFIIILAILG